VKIDLFCRVIDNYGDIGVCWRLARQLASEHAAQVRLIVDVIAWETSSSLPPAPIVIEAFACDPPDAYVHAMAANAIKPIWINLEYLSAEAWIDDVHGLPSPHPRLPLTKFFFCPGFTEKSGGLIREKSLLPESLPSVPRSSASPLVTHTKPRLFAFCYPQAPVRALASALDALVTTASPVHDRDATWQHCAWRGFFPARAICGQALDLAHLSNRG
jgi:uncharacterized repeat protein (TIGR03837 family)